MITDHLRIRTEEARRNALECLGYYVSASGGMSGMLLLAREHDALVDLIKRLDYVEARALAIVLASAALGEYLRTS